MSSLSGSERATVLMVNGLGDQLISVPAMRALGTLFSHPMQLILGEKMCSFFYRDVPLGEDIKRAWWINSGAKVLDVERVAGQVEPCDVFISLCTWTTPSVHDLCRRLGARRTVGYYNFFDVRVPWNPTVHMFDQLFAIPRQLEPSLRLDDFSAAPVFSLAAESAAERYIASNRGLGERLLFLHSETKPEKTWPREHFAWVIQHFLAERPEYKVIVADLTPFDSGSHDGRVLQPHAHLELAMAILRHADLFLGIDSCFLHAADLFRLPGVGLFGPSWPSEFGFRFAPHFRHVAGESMEHVRRESVLEALLDLAKEPGAGSRSEAAQSS